MIGAFFTTAALLAVLWAVQIVNLVTGDALLTHGVSPRRADELPDILTAPFVHFGFAHLIGNTLALAVLCFLTATRGRARFAGVSLVITVVGGLGIWLTAASGTNHAGASILVFGYFGYLLVRGFVDRKVLDILIAFVITAVYGWTMLWGVLPTTDHVSWQGHLFGFAGGVVAAHVFRRRGDDGSPARSDRPSASGAAGTRPLSQELKDLGLL
ncbi:rhomboid family intramembrane serine protease [Yinghuangia sp. ASG 101]|nr:rhomboid family intramembrane serine protease [Yinghuangia sp. ASG 101]UGQ15424.1 rhomboid family intramembrane serine protease [Yinghuangia sp. ASG 101]